MPSLQSAVDIVPPALHAGLAASQLLALQVIRRSLVGDASGGAEGIGWREVGGVLRLAHARMLHHQQAGLLVGGDGAIRLTRHEKRLLRATAAAQIPDPALVDNLIFALAPGRDARPFLTDAIARLAAGLAQHGHRLPLSAIPAYAKGIHPC